MSVSRRHFLGGAAAGVAGTTLAGGLVLGGEHADAQTTASDTPVVHDSFPFHGAHQAGILTPGPADKQNYLSMVSFDTTTSSKADLADLFRVITTRSRLMTRGGALPSLGVASVPADSDVLGPDMPADGLTSTLSVGASLFDGRYGLAAKRPKRLTEMPSFPNDALQAAWTHGDLSLQLCGNHPDTVHHALRDITRHTRGAMQIRWRIEGYNSPPRPSGTSRNLLGFKDGTANPTGHLASNLVWTDSDEPTWTYGGTYQVVRLIEMHVEFWDRVSINEQENMFGRRRDTGAPLDGNSEFDKPDYSADPHGDVIPLDAHIRLANPRTHATKDQRLVRRSYNYDLGVDMNGNLQTGHVFICYQQDLKRQFENVQKRLIGEPLIDYVEPFGGGYFFTLPGVRDERDWLGRGLLT